MTLTEICYHLEHLNQNYSSWSAVCVDELSRNFEIHQLFRTEVTTFWLLHKDTPSNTNFICYYVNVSIKYHQISFFCLCRSPMKYSMNLTSIRRYWQGSISLSWYVTWHLVAYQHAGIWYLKENVFYCSKNKGKLKFDRTSVSYCSIDHAILKTGQK